MQVRRWGQRLLLILMIGVLGACSMNGLANESFQPDQAIHVISREAGSGTRDSFVSVLDILDEMGEDDTHETAVIQSGTSAVMQAVAGDVQAISYLSLGSLDDMVHGISIDGVEPTPENILDGDYPVTRPFMFMHSESFSPAAADFWDFAFSKEGQEIAEETGFVRGQIESAPYVPGSVSGTVSIVGSTSVEPVVQALIERYQTYQPDVMFEVTAPGSGAGIMAVADETADIGMSSRDLLPTEEGKVHAAEAVARDGIVIVVNPHSPVKDLSSRHVREIFSGRVSTWQQVLAQSAE